MISKVKNALLCAKIGVNSKVAVAFSGGCDSAALVHLLNELKAELGFSLCAIHINHCIRVNEADRDAAFAKSFCDKIGISCDAYTVNVPYECKITGESTELCARRLRYDIFNSYTENGYTVVTAHTASDNTETVLFNLARGTGIKGLCGIPFERDGYLRPLISCSRAETEQYCSQNNIDYVTDSSNLSDDYTRNFIRHNIVPQLKKINPSVDCSVGAMSAQLREIDLMLDRMTVKAYNECIISDCIFSRQKLIMLDKPVLSRLVRRIIFDLTDCNADNGLTERVCDVIIKGGRTQLFGDYFVSATKSKVNFYFKEAVNSFCIPLVQGEFSVDNWLLNIISTQTVNKLLMQSTIDCDKIIGSAVIRNRMAGDSIKLPNRPTKSLRKLMNEYEIPLHLRESIPVITDEKGVIFVAGIGVAERVKACDASNRLFIVTVEGNDII